MIDPQTPDFTATPDFRAIAPIPAAGYCALPLVSIVTPFFNTPPEVFQQTLAAVRGQTLSSWEWLIVDDASTDPLAEQVLAHAAATDSRIRIIRREANGGPAGARNTGYAQARANYVFQIDSDDMIEPTALEKFLWFLASVPEASFVSSFQVGFGANCYLNTSGFEQAHSFLTENPMDMTAMVRKEVHAAVGGYDEQYRAGLEDWDFWLKCAEHGYWGYTTPEFLKWYRWIPNQFEKWGNWDRGVKQAQFLADEVKKYPRIYTQGMPRFDFSPEQGGPSVEDGSVWENQLKAERPQLVVVAGGVQQEQALASLCALAAQIKSFGWDLAVCLFDLGDNSQLARLAAQTSNVFVFSHFLPNRQIIPFLRYLLRSRGSRAAVLLQNPLSYKLGVFLQRACPELLLLDFSGAAALDLGELHSQLLAVTSHDN